MSRQARIERPRGTHDVIPAEQPAWRRVTTEIERLCALYGYHPITTPVFEDTALFERTSGAGSDVVQKEMYTFADRSDRSLTLRPEGTAPICRAYVEHGFQREPQPLKLFTIASMYRYGAPGKGRYREHWQASVEAIGSDDASVDAELIQLYDTLLRRLGVTQYHLELNSIGCRECRPAYLRELASWLEANLDRLDDATREKAATSPLRVFDNYQAKPDAVRAALDEAPKIGESLCAACSERFAVVRRDLDATGVEYRLEPTLVRGLDYYSRTTWEFVGPLENENATLSGGGRYDYLVEEIGGPPTPGVGFGAGIERLLARARGGGRHDGCGPDDRRLLRARRGRARESSSPAGSPSFGRPGSPPTPTTRAARSRASSRRPAASERRRSSSSITRRATLRRPGSADEDVTHDELPARLSR